MRSGVLDPTDPSRAMTTDTVFDMASLTKIMAVWAPIDMLWENGTLALNDPLAALVPELDGYPLGHVTVFQLLTHTAGVPLRANLRALYGTDPAAIRRGVLHEQLHRPSAEAVEYTDRPLSSSASSSNASPETDSTTPLTSTSGRHWAWPRRGSVRSCPR